MQTNLIGQIEFIHLSVNHRISASAVPGDNFEVCFEAERMDPEHGEYEIIYQTNLDLQEEVEQRNSPTMREIVGKHLERIRQEVFVEEDLHTHDP